MAKKSKARQRAVQIEVRESGVHGRGVYAAQFIPEGARIIEYTGERVSWEAAPDDDDDPHTFNFGLENGDVINPEVGGNDARWINHSCDPNCETVEEDDRIFIYACATSNPARNSFMIITWSSTNRSPNQPRRSSRATAAPQIAAAQ